MLLKKSNNIRLHRLRIIQLIESDFNQFLRISFTRPLAHKGEDLEWIHVSQFARTECACLTKVLLKVLTYKYIRINRRNRVSIDNDAKGCFDQIVPVLALIACQAFGATLTSCQSLGSVWHDMQHHVKFGSRVSNATYPKDLSRNQYGAGRAAASPHYYWSS
jgi:hypothetical protein